MKVALIGGTGFVGSYIVDELLQAGHIPRILVRPGHGSRVNHDSCETVTGDVTDQSSLSQTINGCDALVYLIGILREFPSRGITFEALQYQGFADSLKLAEQAGIQRVILMSANGVGNGSIPYQSTKFRAEQLLKQSNVRGTVFQPSVIFGDPRGRMEFCTQLKRDLVDPPLPASVFFPGINLLKAGQQMMSPVHVSDVAAAFVNALDNPETYGKSWVLAGPDTLSWADIIRTIARASGKPGKWLMPAPAWGVSAVARLFERFPWFPLTSDQVTMLMQGNAGSSDEIFRLLDISPTSFNEKALEYLKR